MSKLDKEVVLGDRAMTEFDVLFTDRHKDAYDAYLVQKWSNVSDYHHQHESVWPILLPSCRAILRLFNADESDYSRLYDDVISYLRHGGMRQPDASGRPLSLLLISLCHSQ